MSSVAFTIAVAFLLDHLEGGGKHVTDTGGHTRFGISKRAHPEVDIENLTREQAVEIIRRDYWDPVRASELPTGLALLVFDAAVNMGPRPAVRMLQRVLRVNEDGILGPTTLAKARAFYPARELRALYNEERLRRYEEIARVSDEHARQLVGWRRRVMRVADEAGRWSDLAARGVNEERV